MNEKKPLSDKKLKRLLKKEAKKEKISVIDPSVFALPKEWENIPKNLKGKEIGLWYKKRRQLVKQIEELKAQMEKKPKLTKKERKALLEEASKNDKSKKNENKLTKKEKRALRKLEKQMQDEDSGLFRISFDIEKENMILDYLQSVSDIPPTFLLPHVQYHKRLKGLADVPKNNDDCDQMEISNEQESKTVQFNDEYLNQTLEKVKRLADSVPSDLKKLPVPAIKRFLSEGTFGNIKIEDNQMDTCDDFNRESNNTEYPSKDDRCCLDSVDKYKHLEDTPFKQQFLSILSGSIDTTLEKAVRVNSKLKRMQSLDEEIFESYKMRSSRPGVRKIMEDRKRLPAFNMRTEILDLINSNQVVLISGETGCGKTTQVAQFILDEAIVNMNASLCNIVCTQPRRISAISVAQRVADERGEILGKDGIGYQIRLERKIGRNKGAILYCTTGILLQFMQSDPALSKYSHVILDEIHERDILCDFVLTILKEVISKRTDLKIILMSATLNAEQFSRYFYDCPMMNIPGYTHPVDEYYLEDILQATKFSFNKKRHTDVDEGFKNSVLPYIDELRKRKTYSEHVLQELSNPDSEKINPDLVVEVIKYICRTPIPGAVLVFMSGLDDINAVIKKLNLCELFPPERFVIIPLHSMLPTANQRIVFDPPPPGKRKIIVATNIAETSITIDDVVYVIDCGRIKIKNYDVVNNICTLKPEFVSRANARQRRGRAGRVQSGVCYHLFSRGRESVLDDYPLPEMLRTRLEEVILNIKLLQLGKVGPFLQRVPDSPDPKAVSLALQLLLQLNAIDENENLTPLGYHLAKLPLDPQIGKMLLMGVTMSCLTPILAIAATLSHKDAFYLPLGEEKLLNERKLALDKGHKSDHLIMAEVLEQWEKLEKSRGGRKKFCEENFLTQGNLFQLRDLKVQFVQYLYEMGFLPSKDYRRKDLNMNSNNVAIVKAVICSGLYPNVAIIDDKSRSTGRKKVSLKTCEDGQVHLHPKSVNTVQPNEFESRFLVYHQKLLSTNIFLHDTTMVPTLPLLIFCHDYYMSIKNNEMILELNKRLRFSCTPKVADMIEELKLRLCWLLEYKLSHPGEITWKDNSADINLLKILTDLFTSENDVMMSNMNNRSDEDSS